MECSRLEGARAAIEGMVAGVPVLARASRAQMLTVLDSSSGDFSRLAAMVRSGGVTEQRLEKLAKLVRGTDHIVSESFALAAGALLRSNGLDAGECLDADLFIAKLASITSNG